jgi:hypothetical protein
MLNQNHLEPPNLIYTTTPPAPSEMESFCKIRFGFLIAAERPKGSAGTLENKRLSKTLAMKSGNGSQNSYFAY